jgi:activator of HSP90 ATPase
MSNKVVNIKQVVRILASPEKVYDSFVDPKKHSEFTGSKASGKAEIGGKFTAWDGYSFGKYLELDEGKRIVQTWQTTDWPKGYPPSRLELILKEIPEGTELTMIQSEVPAEQEEELAGGWIEFYWEPLKKYFQRQP